MSVLGGGLTEAMPDLVRDEVEAGVRANSKPESKKSLEVVVAALKDHSVTTGAAKLAFEKSEVVVSTFWTPSDPELLHSTLLPKRNDEPKPP